MTREWWEPRPAATRSALDGGIWEEESHFKGQDPKGPRGPGGRTNSVYVGISPHVPCVTLLSAPDGALAAHVEWLWRAGRSCPESQRRSVEF